MGTTQIPQTLRSPTLDRLTDKDGMASPIFQQYLSNLDTTLNGLVTINITSFGAKGNGLADDTIAFLNAAKAAAAQGGAVILIPSGSYNISSFSTPVGTAPINFLGAGNSTLINCKWNAPDGMGHMNIQGSNVTLDSMLVDGNKTVPSLLAYNLDFLGVGGNDPMALSLTKNTSVWLHGNTTGFTVRNVEFRHTAGYAVLVDCMAGGIQDVGVLGCRFRNNRASLFGLIGGPFLYGSFNGGVFIKGDGRAAFPGRILKGFFMQDCDFARNTGNCVWSHLYGLDELHQNFRYLVNNFEDCGLDGILVGGVTAGIASQNTFRRVGYVCTDDSGPSVPRWLTNLQATALDSSGLVKGFPYTNNSFCSINGGCIDMDGHGDSAITGNVCRTPYPDEPEYTEDQIASTGPTNNDPASYGLNLGNSSKTPYGAANIEISGNTFINLPAGSMRLYAARRVHATGNNIVAPDVSFYPPIGMGPVGPGPNQRCYDNKVSHNNIHYNPPAAIPAIFEDDTISPFVSTEKNAVFGNTPITPSGGSAIEFQKSPTSGSTVYSSQVWFP